MLRSDYVIFTENNKELEDWCKWFAIPILKFITAVDTNIFNDIVKITIINSENRDSLNTLFSLFKDKDVILFGNTVNNPGIKMAIALGGAQ